jgi:hypothetical protein
MMISSFIMEILQLKANGMEMTDVMNKTSIIQ